VSRRAVVVVVLAELSACGTPAELVCESDEQCGDFGVCIDESCALPDDTCPFGLRFHESAGERANECVDFGDGLPVGGDTPDDPLPLVATQTIDLKDKSDDYEPDCVGSTGGKDVFFEITLSDFGRLYVDTFGSDFHVALAVARGTCASAGFEFACGTGSCNPTFDQFSDVLDPGTYCVIADQFDGQQTGTHLTVRSSVGPAADLAHDGTNFGDTCDADVWKGSCAGDNLPEATWFFMTCDAVQVLGTTCASDPMFDGHLMAFGLDLAERVCRPPGCVGGVVDIAPGGTWVVLEASSGDTCDLVQLDLTVP